jgi:hypothetical protein
MSAEGEEIIVQVLDEDNVYRNASGEEVIIQPTNSFKEVVNYYLQKEEKFNWKNCGTGIGKFIFVVGNSAASVLTFYAIAEHISTPYPWLTDLYYGTPLVAIFLLNGRVSKNLWDYYKSFRAPKRLKDYFQPFRRDFRSLICSKEGGKIILILPVSILAGIPSALIFWHQYQTGSITSKYVMAGLTGLSTANVSNYSLLNVLNQIIFRGHQHKNSYKIKLLLINKIKKLKYIILNNEKLSLEVRNDLQTINSGDSFQKLVNILKDININPDNNSFNLSAAILILIAATGGIPFILDAKAGLQNFWKVERNSTLNDTVAGSIAGISYLPTTLLVMYFGYMALTTALSDIASSYARNRHPWIAIPLYLIFGGLALFSYAGSVELVKQHISPEWANTMKIICSCGALLFHFSSLPVVINDVILEIGKFLGNSNNKILAKIYSNLEKLAEAIEKMDDNALKNGLSLLTQNQKNILLGAENLHLLDQREVNRPPERGMIRRYYSGMASSVCGFFSSCNSPRFRENEAERRPLLEHRP